MTPHSDSASLRRSPRTGTRAGSARDGRPGRRPAGSVRLRRRQSLRRPRRGQPVRRDVRLPEPRRPRRRLPAARPDALLRRRPGELGHGQGHRPADRRPGHRGRREGRERRRGPTATGSRRPSAWPTCGWTARPRCLRAPAPRWRGAARSGSRRPCRCGRNWSTRSPSGSAGAMGDVLPEEMQAMAGPLLGMMRSMGGAMFGSQIGQALGTLAGEVVGSTDVGLPLGPAGKAALLPANIAAFGEGLGVPQEEVRLYLALREAAHQRLFAHVPWLRAHLFGAVEGYARGIKVDTARLEEAVGQLDPHAARAAPGGAAAGHVPARGHPGAEGRAGPPGDRSRARRGLGGRGRARGRRPAPAVRGRAARDAAPPPGHRRTRRADLRHPDRPGAAAPPAAGRLPAVGLAHRRPRGRRPRRPVGAPGHAADGRRPGRPGRLRAPRA